MTYRKSLLAGVLLLVASACSQSGGVNPTATVLVHATATVLQIVTPAPIFPSPTPIVPVVTDTSLPPTAPVVTDTPLPPPAQSPLPADTATTASVSILGEHQIKAGETLSCIGRGYGVLPKAIADANGIQLTSILRVGQLLRIPAVQWTNIPAGPVCPPQFPSPFSPSPQPPNVSTPTLLPLSSPTGMPTLQLPDTPTPTSPPIPASATPTLRLPDTPTPTQPPGPTGIPAGTPGPP